MLSLETELRLARVLAQVAECDRAVELSRQVLAEQIDFEPYAAFKRLDREGKGYLIAQDMVEFLRDNNYACTQHEGYLLLRIYDQNGNGRISYNEFMDAILPQDSAAMRNIAVNRQTYYVGPQDFLVYDVEFALSRIFEKELDQFHSLESVKRDLADRYDFYFHAAYRLVEQDGHQIGSLALADFLNKNGFVLSDSDMTAIVRRFDSTGDARISYSEFCDRILPYEPYYHYYPRYRYYRYYPLRQYYDDSYYNRSYRSTLPLSARGRSTYASPTRGAYTSRSFAASPARTSQSFMASPSRSAYASRSFAVSPGRALSTSPNRSVLSPTAKSPTREEFTTPTKSPARSNLSYTPEKNSPLREEDEEELVRTLKNQIESDRELESVKQSLSLQSDFNLLDAFRLFDVKGRGWITSSELESGLKDFGVYPTRDELYLFMRRLDRDSDGRVRYSDFCDVFTPKQSEYSSLMNKRVPHNADLYYDSHSTFKSYTRDLFKDALRLLLESESDTERKRQRLSRRPDFKLYDAFQACDFDQNGYITVNEIKEKLNDHGVYASEKDLVGLMNKFDKNRDGRITYSEFVEEVAPKSPSRYQDPDLSES